jgi:polyhydroxybutyrate depolymerase
MQVPFRVATALLPMILFGCGSGTPSAPPPASSPSAAAPAPTATAEVTVAATPSRPTTTNAQVEVDGQTRDFTVVAPPDVATRDRLPLLLVLHGAEQSKQDPEGWGFNPFATDPGAIVVFPQGERDPDQPNRPGYVWNAGQTDTGTDDVAFIKALVDQLEATYPIDQSRVFVAGASNGGQMAYRAACELADRILGVAVFSGALLVDCRPVRPLLAIDIHGTSDTMIPIAGGGTGCQPLDCPPIADTMERLRKIDGCGANPDVSTIAADTIATDYESCDEGSALLFIQAGGVDHFLNGIKIDIPTVTWEFLMAHRR